MSEHYEITDYGNLIPLADHFGIDVIETLEATLREKQEALDVLPEIGKEFDYGALLKTTHGVGIVRYWFEAMKSRSWIWQSSSSTSLRRHYA